MINVYVFGSPKFIKESIKDFNPKEYNISTTDNPELFKIQLSQEEDPRSVVLIDKNRLEGGGIFGRINPLGRKNKLELDFIKNNPFLSQEVSSIELEEYRDIKKVLEPECEHEEQEEEETPVEIPPTPGYTQEVEEEETPVEEENKEIQEGEFDLEELLANGVETIGDEADEKEEEFDLDAIIAGTLEAEEEEKGENNLLDLEEEAEPSEESTEPSERSECKTEEEPLDEEASRETSELKERLERLEERIEKLESSLEGGEPAEYGDTTEETGVISAKLGELELSAGDELEEASPVQPEDELYEKPDISDDETEEDKDEVEKHETDDTKIPNPAPPKKTTAQNIMEHLSEDEIVQMVREGKL